MPFDCAPVVDEPKQGATTAVEALGTNIIASSAGAVTPRPILPWYMSRRAEGVDAAVAVLVRARKLISDERHWCKRAFAFTWLDIRDHYVAICTAILCARRHQTGRLRPWVACRKRQQGARMANRAAGN